MIVSSYTMQTSTIDSRNATQPSMYEPSVGTRQALILQKYVTATGALTEHKGRSELSHLVRAMQRESSPRSKGWHLIAGDGSTVAIKLAVLGWLSRVVCSQSSLWVGNSPSNGPRKCIITLDIKHMSGY